MANKKSGSFGKEENKKLNPDQRKQMREELAETLTKYRNTRGYSQDELSKLCGYNYDIATRWEGALKPHITPEDAQKIIDVLELPGNAFDKFSTIIVPRKYDVGKYKEMGPRLKALLDERGIKQNELAAALDLYPQHINGFIGGTIEPKIFFIRKIVDYFFEEDRRQEGLNYLFYGERPPKLSYKKQLIAAAERIKQLESEIKELKK